MVVFVGIVRVDGATVLCADDQYDCRLQHHLYLEIVVHEKNFFYRVTCSCVEKTAVRHDRMIDFSCETRVVVISFSSSLCFPSLNLSLNQYTPSCSTSLAVVSAATPSISVYAWHEVSAALLPRLLVLVSDFVFSSVIRLL